MQVHFKLVEFLCLCSVESLIITVYGDVLALKVEVENPHYYNTHFWVMIAPPSKVAWYLYYISLHIRKK